MGVMMKPLFKTKKRENDAGAITEKISIPARWQWLAFAIGVAIILVPWIWKIWSNYHQAPEIKTARLQKAAVSSATPCIIVLPFDNASADPEQKYFSDGLSEDITAALSKMPNLMIIARHSSYAYTGKPIDAAASGRDFGATHVLEGSFRRTDERMQISARLTDSAKGVPIWSATFDRELSDFFQLEEEIISNILAALQIDLTGKEPARRWRPISKNIDAYLKIMQAREHFRRFTQEANGRCRELAGEALVIDPDNAAAHRLIAWTYLLDARAADARSAAASLERAVAAAQNAQRLDETDADLYHLWAGIHLLDRQYDAAIGAIQKASALDPNNADIFAYKALILNCSGQPTQARTDINAAMRLNPLYPAWYEEVSGMSHQLLGQYEAALTACKNYKARRPDDSSAHARLAIIYSLLERKEDARAEVEAILRIDPNFTLARWAQLQRYRYPAVADVEIEALRRAGLR